MIQLQSLLVKNFKNIQLADLTFAPLNVVVGPNGSGKSNLLLSISFLKFLLKGSTDEVEGLLNGDYNLQFADILPPSGEDCEIAVTLRNSKTDIIYAYSLTLSQVITAGESSKVIIKKELLTLKKRTSTGVPTTIFDRTGSKLSFHKTLKRAISLNQVSSSISGFRALSLFKEELEVKYKNAIYALNKILDTQTFYLSPHVIRNVAPTRGYHYESRLLSFNLEDAIIELSESSNWGQFISAVRSIANLKDIEISSFKGKDGKETKFVMFYSFNKTNILQELSDGMIIMIALILKVVTSDNCVIFLEEPENSIHPRALQNFMHFIREHSESKQFLVTTHSSTLLNLVQPEEVFVAHLDESGQSTISSVANVKELRAKLSKGFISFGDLIFEALDDEQEFEDIF